MRQLIRIILVCGFFFLCGCGVVAIHWGEDFRESFVEAYWNVDYSESANIEIEGYFGRFMVTLPRRVYAQQFYNREPETEEERLLQERFEELSEKNGDVGFDRWVSGTVDNLPDVWNTDNLISAISIVSNADFDESHLAGESLADIVQIEYCTHKQFIENGYEHQDEQRAVNDYTGDVVTKLLSEFSKEDSLFMDVNFYEYGNSIGNRFTFVQKPTLSMLHTITMTIEFEDRIVPYKFSFDIDFTPVE